MFTTKYFIVGDLFYSSSMHNSYGLSSQWKLVSKTEETLDSMRLAVGKLYLALFWKSNNSYLGTLSINKALRTGEESPRRISQ